MSTFAQLKSNVSKELGLDETAAGDEDTLLGRRLNQAVREFLLDTHCYVKAGTFTAVANQADYDFQSTTSYITMSGGGGPESAKVILAIETLYDSNNVPLERVNVSEIDEFRRASATTATAAQRFYAFDGANLFMLWPTPSTAEAFSIRVVPRPTEMSSAAHDPSDPTYGGVPAEYHEAIEKWACWYMASYDDDVSSTQGDRYLGQYQMQVSKCRRAMKLKGGRRQARLRLGRRAPVVSSDPART